MQQGAELARSWGSGDPGALPLHGMLLAEAQCTLWKPQAGDGGTVGRTQCLWQREGAASGTGAHPAGLGLPAAWRVLVGPWGPVCDTRV